MDLAPGYYVFSCVIALILAVYHLLRPRTAPKGLRLPPGPAPKPFVGNVYDMPKSFEYETFTRWAKEYGDLVSVRVFDKHIVYINSSSVAHDLFGKRSALYSDRFDFPMLNDLIGYNYDMATMRYGERWRRHRKLVHQKFNHTAVLAYQLSQTKQTRILLCRLKESPNQFLEHLRHFGGAIIMEIVYGIDVLQKDDPYIDIADRAMAVIGRVASPGTFLVDMLPFLKYVPEWMPGAGFRKKARIWGGYIADMRDVPFEATKKAFESGSAAPSYTASLLGELAHRSDTLADEEDIIRHTAAGAYGAGAESTSTVLTWFVLAMATNPDVQRTAQAELDAVVGPDRLPTFADRKLLPYTSALCHELYRWHPVAPLAVAHRLTQDDVYGDYFIPGGSIVVGNVWALSREEKVYGANPDRFDPARFLAPGMQEFTSPAFGFGRRVCPGRYLADNSVFIAVASVLKAFDISPAKAPDGQLVPIEISWTSGSVSRPNPFQCAITPRCDVVVDRLYAHSDEC